MKDNISLMRFFVFRYVFSVLLTLAFAGVANAAGKDVIIENDDSLALPQQRLERLYTDLKRERNPEKALQIANQIRVIHSTSGGPTITLLLQWAEKAAEEKRNAAALDFLDQAIALKPQYAEGWNARATLNFSLGNYRRAMTDIEEVLKREPRHFGALAGMAAIFENSGNDKLALKAMERFLDIYPADRDIQKQVNDLNEKLASQRT